ncbi:MAG: tetratricopeptide repeat protein [Zoogloeaceae bacterium]|nr:tetratricopeptide repeat protein [Zoogloeaceae bacterium]
MLPKSSLICLATLFSLTAAFAAAPDAGTDETADADKTPPAAETPEETSGITGQQVFQLLLGEVALQRDELELAVSAYHDLALRSRDLEVTRRAVELALAARQYPAALELAQLWLELEPDSQNARLTEANLLLGLGRIAELDAPVTTLLAAEPERLGENFLSLSRFLVAYPDKKAARAFIGRMTRLYPNLSEAHYVLALAESSAGEMATARQEAKRARELKPEWLPPVLLEAQLILREPGEASSDAAARLFFDYLTRQPDAEEARMALARILIGAKRYKEARVQFDLLLKDAPNNPDAIYPIAMLALQEKDFETARALLTRLANLPFPDPDSVHYFLGLLEEEAGNPEASLAHLHQVSGGVQYLYARARIAQNMVKEGQVDAALALLRESHVRNAADRMQLLQLEAQLLRGANRWDAAYALLSQALATEPEQPELLYDAALAAEKVGKPEEMEKHLKKLIALQPDNAHAYNALGYSLADRSLRLEEAHALIARAVDLAPEDPFIMDSMGWVLYRQGKVEEARAVLEDAYRLKADPEIAAHLGEILWIQGRRDEAQSLWQQAADAAPENETLQAAMRKFQP